MELFELIDLIRQNTFEANIKIISYLNSEEFSTHDIGKNDYYLQLLKAAIAENNNSIFDFLINKDQDLLKFDNEHIISCYSAESGNIEFLERIINKLSNTSICKIAGFNALCMRTIFFGRLDIIQTLAKHNYQFSNEHLFYAIFRKQLNIVEYFIEKYSINIETKSGGYSLLQHSLSVGAFEITDYLLDKGANVKTYAYKQKNILSMLTDATKDMMRFPFSIEENFIHQMKLHYKIFTKIIFAVFCKKRMKVINIPNDQKQEVKSQIKKLIEDEKMHLEIDRKLLPLFKSNFNETIDNIMQKCSLKLYKDFDTIDISDESDKIITKILDGNYNPTSDGITSLKLLAVIEAVIHDKIGDHLIPIDLKPLITAASVIKPLLQGDIVDVVLNDYI